MSEKFYVGLDLTSSEDNGTLKPISRVTLLVDNENSYTAGDDTGRELVADCAHATQAMVDSILAQVKGYQYRAYGVSDANIDPAAELGDGVTADGMYSVISRIKDDGSGYVGLSAPGEAEMEDEYPSTGPMTQEFTRQLAQTRSLITKTAEEIRLEVANLENDYSRLELYVDSLTLSVSNGSTSSTIKLMAGSAEIASQTINMTGLVTYTGLSSGTTTIDGACIKTGTIDAERLNLTGAITWSDLSSSVQSDIDEAYDMAYDAQSLANDVDDTVSGWRYGSTTYIDGTMLMTGTVMASELLGGEVGLLTSAERTAGGISITGSSTSTYAVDFYSNGELLLSGGSDVVIECEAIGTYIELSGHIYVGGGDLLPATNNYSDLGSSTHNWASLNVYSVNEVSDLTKKNSVIYGLDAYDAFFDGLKPMSFLFNGGTSGRRHTGLGAQDVEQNLIDCGLTSMDFAGFIKSPRKDETGQVIEGEYDYALRYSEFVSLLIDQVQKLKNRVNELEGKS